MKRRYIVTLACLPLFVVAVPIHAVLWTLTQVSRFVRYRVTGPIIRRVSAASHEPIWATPGGAGRKRHVSVTVALVVAIALATWAAVAYRELR